MAQDKTTENGKKKGLGGAFGSFTGAIDEIVNEVKRDLREMTPPPADPNQKRKQEQAQKAAEISKVLSTTYAGIAETELEGPAETASKAPLPRPSAPEPDAKASAAGLDLPGGNLWHHLANPAYANRLRGDTCYHALTAADVESYARAIGNETKAPYTLGLVAVSLPALTEEDMDHAEGAQALDVLAQTLLKTIEEQVRLFGIVGAGPRQIWPDIRSLDRFLTDLLNTHRKLVALGPIGIDEPFAPYTVPQQQAQLALQMEMAMDFGIPVLLTSKNSAQPLLETVRKVGRTLGGMPPLVYLDAVQTPEDVALVEELGCHVLLRPELTQPGFAGASFYQKVPVARLLMASGSALVAPHGFSGHFNQPKFLGHTLQAAAKLRGSSAETLQANLNANLVKFFGVA